MTGDANKFGAAVVERRSSSGLVEQQNGGAITIEAAHKKGSGSTKNGRDSKPKMLGVKIYGDQAAQPGAIIVRQRGTKVRAFVVPPGNLLLGIMFCMHLALVSSILACLIPACFLACFLRDSVVAIRMETWEH